MQITYNPAANMSQKKQQMKTFKRMARKEGFTKQARKMARTEDSQEAKLTPTDSDALLNGYAKIMAVLGRGCSVSAA